MVGRHSPRVFICERICINYCPLFLLAIFPSLPIGLVAFVVMGVVSILQQKLPLKWVILIGETLGITGSALLPFANTKNRYWRFAFPGLCIGTAGMTIVFATAK